MNKVVEILIGVILLLLSSMASIVAWVSTTKVEELEKRAQKVEEAAAEMTTTLALIRADLSQLQQDSDRDDSQDDLIQRQDSIDGKHWRFLNSNRAQIDKLRYQHGLEPLPPWSSDND